VKPSAPSAWQIATELDGRSHPPADGGLTQKAHLNGVAALLDYSARLVTGFVVNPFLVAGLGDVLYGLWQVLSRSIGYLSAASGRTPQALKVVIAYQKSCPDYDAKRRSIGSALAVSILFAPILAGAGAVFAWAAPWLFGVSADMTMLVRVAIALLVVNVVAMSLADIPSAVMAGENLGYKRMGLSAALVMTGGGLTVLAIVLQTGLVGVAAAQLATTILTGAVLLRVVRTHVAWFGLARPTLTAGRRFLNLSGWFVVWRFVNQGMLASDVILLGLLTRMELVTMYSITKYGADTLIGLASIIVSSAAPGLGGIIGTGAIARARSVRGQLMAITWLTTVTAGTSLLLWSRSFVGLWIGDRYYAGTMPMLFIVLLMMQFVFIRNDALIIDLTLDVRRKVILGAVAVTASVLVAGMLLALGGGIVGLCVGLITGRAILSLGYPWLLGQFLQVPVAAQLQSLSRPAFVTVALLSAATMLEPVVQALTWPRLVLGVGLTALLTSVIALYGGLAAGPRRIVLNQARQLAQRPWRRG
jgi:O-antigen/teichoic acid export membrane protein